MKKLTATLCFSTIILGAFAQGTVNFQNSVGLNISTNALGIGGTVGNINGAWGGPYYFALLTASSTITSVDANLQDLVTPTWSFGIYGTNTSTPGRMTGGTGVAVPNWLPGTTNSYIVVGWSASLGSTWAQVTAFINGMERGPNNTWHLSGPAGTHGFLGTSTVGFGTAGGPAQPLPYLPWGVFGNAATAGGTPVQGFSIDSAFTIPEPSIAALAGLGAALMTSSP